MPTPDLMKVWWWGFEDGVLGPHRIPSSQTTGLPPEWMLAYPSPLLGEQYGGWMPVSDTEDTRAILLEEFEANQVHRYERVSYSKLTDEQIAEMSHVFRGAAYRARGTLQEQREDSK